MTVLVRPAPARVAGNRIVPFRPVQYTNKVRPVALKDWKPPVPEPLKPAPLLGLVTLAALGVQALASQVWGLLNPTRGVSPANNNTTIPITDLKYSPGAAVSYTGINEGPSNFESGGYATHGWYYGAANNNAGAPFTDREPTFFYRQPADPHPVPGNGVQTYPALRWHDPRDGQEKESWLITSFWMPGNKITIRPNSGDQATWLPFSDGTTTEPLALPELIPSPEPAATPPAPLPLPLPSTVPQVAPQPEPQTLPAPSPLVPVTPGPVAPPIVRPATPVSPVQPKVPATTGISNGRVIAPAPVPVPTTDPTAITPWPGAAPIPGTGPAPAPTLQGIAQEVGRIERKMEVMMTPNAPGNLVDQLANLADLIGPIVSAILAAGSGTTYMLDSPCELDEATGEKLPPVEVEAPGALTQFGAILNRIDAIAELIQVHKDLKQPNCKPQTPTGEFVTVNFEQID